MNYLKIFFTILYIISTFFYIEGDDSITVVPKPTYESETVKKLIESLRNANFDQKFIEMRDSVISELEKNPDLDESVSYISQLIINSNLSNEEKGTFFEELVDAAKHANENK